MRTVRKEYKDRRAITPPYIAVTINDQIHITIEGYEPVLIDTELGEVTLNIPETAGWNFLNKVNLALSEFGLDQLKVALRHDNPRIQGTFKV